MASARSYRSLQLPFRLPCVFSRSSARSASLHFRRAAGASGENEAPLLRTGESVVTFGASIMRSCSLARISVPPYRILRRKTHDRLFAVDLND